MHNDQWEGQQWNRSPGNLYSDVKKVSIDPARADRIELVCDNVIPPIDVPPDTEWVKRIKQRCSLSGRTNIRSKIAKETSGRFKLSG